MSKENINNSKNNIKNNKKSKNNNITKNSPKKSLLTSAGNKKLDSLSDKEKEDIKNFYISERSKKNRLPRKEIFKLITKKFSLSGHSCLTLLKDIFENEDTNEFILKPKSINLSDKDIEYIKHIYYSEMSHKEKMEVLSAKYNKAERTIRGWWNKLNLYKNSTGTDIPKQILVAQERIIDDDTDVVFVTSAQNKTPVNRRFLNSLMKYKEFLEKEKNKKVQIIIIPTTYRNPTSNVEHTKEAANEWWNDDVDPYLYFGKLKFGDTLISADTRISPTAKDPLNGYEILASENNLILPHSKIHYKTLPRLKGDPLRVMTTTGYITSKNYSKSKAGEVAYENHSYGFCVVELKPNYDGEKAFLPRNVKVTKDGTFIDLIYSVTPDTVTTIEDSQGFVWGDIHTRVIDYELVLNTRKLIDKLKPKTQILHDIFDGSTVNPHEEKDLFIKKRKIVEGLNDISDEVNEMLNFIEEIKEYSENVYIVESNHDIFLDRHICSFDWRKDLYNSEHYLKYALIQQTVDLRKYGNIIGYLIHERFNIDNNNNIKYIKMGDSLIIGDYQCALHGDWSTNGSKGSTKGFSKLNRKMIHGHTHSPQIFNNVTCVGVSSQLNQYYNRKGFSSWAHAHSIIHSNNKNQLIVFDDNYEICGYL